MYEFNGKDPRVGRPLVLVDSDGNEEPALWLATRENIVFIALRDVSGRLYPVTASMNGLVESKLGKLYWKDNGISSRFPSYRCR